MKQSIEYFYSLLEERNFHNLSSLLKEINSKVSKVPEVIIHNDKHIVRYSDNNEFVFYFSFYDNKLQECRFSYHYPVKNNSYGYSTTCGYTVKPNDTTNLCRESNIKIFISDINYHIKNAEISKSIIPMTFKAEIALYETHELKVIALFETTKELALEKLKKLYPNAIICSLTEV